MLFCVRFHYEHKNGETQYVTICAENEEELYRELSSRYPGISDLEMNGYYILRRSHV